METVCQFCGEPVVDGRDVSGFTGEGPDWMTPSGDFGCDESPETDDEGCGSHAVTEAEYTRAVCSDVARQVTERREAAERHRRDVTRELERAQAYVADAVNTYSDELRALRSTLRPGTPEADALSDILDACARWEKASEAFAAVPV